MDDLVKKIHDWHMETFPDATRNAVWDKLFEETDELNESVFLDCEDDIFDEFADVFIVMVRFCEKHNTTIKDVIESKFNRVAARKYGEMLPNGDRIKLK